MMGRSVTRVSLQCFLSLQSQRKIIQIYVSTGNPGSKDLLSLAVRRHSVTMRTGTTGEPVLPGKIFVGDPGDYRKTLGLPAADSLGQAALLYGCPVPWSC